MRCFTFVTKIRNVISVIFLGLFLTACGGSSSSEVAANLAPNGSIDTPSENIINVGDTLDFTGTGSDPDGNLPLTYHWSFGAGSGIADANIEDPGPKQFNNAGAFTVSFTVSDSLGLADPVPAVSIITVKNPSPPPVDPLTVSTVSGDVVGIVEGSADAFLGIPYASPPVGDGTLATSWPSPQLGFAA